MFRFAALVLAVLATGCASALHKASQRFADNLSTAILSGTIRARCDGVPGHLLLIDGLIQGDPQNAGLQAGRRQLYGAYAGGFVGETGGVAPGPAGPSTSAVAACASRQHRRARPRRSPSSLRRGRGPGKPQGS